jgi:hypothetical protein
VIHAGTERRPLSESAQAMGVLEIAQTILQRD